MKLVIVESPTKAKTLTPILGKAYKVKASMGHIRDLPKKGFGVDVDNNFKPEYDIPEKAVKTIAELKKYAENAESVILATDPDREGEAIAWHLKQILEGKVSDVPTPVVKKPRGRRLSKEAKAAKAKKEAKALEKKAKVPAVDTFTEDDNDPKYSRVVFHELTKTAIEEAFAHPGKLDLNLVDAQQARRVLDRLVGYKLSPLLWKKVMFGLSAGRVQSVAVRLVVERERERMAFKPEEYWSIVGNFENNKNLKISADLLEKKGKKLEITSETQAKKIETALEDDIFKISEIKKSERQRKPYAPVKTSTLQQMGSNVFGYTAKRTMIAAQRLFENGFITYHRTDSLNLSPQFVESARTFIGQKFGKQFLPDEGIYYKTNSKNAQEAHEAIRPTDIKNIPGKFDMGKLGEEEVKVYSLIWKRSLECQMLPAIYDQTSVQIDSEKGYGFKANGSVIKFAGWLAVSELLGLNTDEEDISILADFKENEVLNLQNLKMDQHFTQPPARYSDATLIKTLEELGIGRPSTYAPTISTIQTRGYVIKEGKYFIPADVAFVVTDLLVNNFPDIVDLQFTAEIEKEFDEIAEGTRKWVPVIREFYLPFAKIVEDRDKNLQKSDVTLLGESSESCPDCGRPLVYKLGKYGKFLSCSGFPDCTYAKPIMEIIHDGENGSQHTTGGQMSFGKCPNCEDGILIMKQGPYGKFIGCSNYPKCKTIQKYLEKVGVKCPKCEIGDVVVKKAKRGVFYGCSRYPECDYSTWKKPVVPGSPEAVAEVSAGTVTKENGTEVNTKEVKQKTKMELLNEELFSIASD